MQDRIIFYTPYYHPESFPHNSLIEELTNRNYQITVITSLPNYRKYGFYKGFNLFGPYLQYKKNLRIYRLPIIPRFNDKLFSIFLFYLSFFLSSIFFLSFYSLLHRKKYTYFISFCGSPVYVGILGNFFAKIIGAKHFQWIQDIWPEAIQTTQKANLKYIKSIINIIQIWMWNKADVLLSQSEELRNYLAVNTKAKLHKVLFNPVRELSRETAIFPPMVNEKLVITYMGAIGSGKYIEESLDAIISIKNEKIEYNLCGIGSLHNELSTRYYQQNIKWNGWLEVDELDHISNKTDYFIFGLETKDRQSLILPSKLQTYCMYGKPIICCAEGAAKALIKNNNIGIVCEEQTKEGIILAVTKAISLSKEERSLMGNNARNYFKNNFTKEKIADQCVKIFDELREMK